MSQKLYILAIRFKDEKKHENITRLKWKITNNELINESPISEIITIINNHPNSVFVKDKKDNKDVEVFVIDANPKYLRTKANNKLTDNLLELPTF
jgi:hypothetical protein